MSTLENHENTRAYHHGDLRNTLIQLGTAMLLESGEAALSLRKLAQRAGVSHNAPYQHFADKDALIAAIAEEGFRRLGDIMEEALAAQQSAIPETRLIAIGRAYVAFALAHPAHLQVMFSAFPSAQYPSLVQQSTQTLARLVAVVREIGDQGGLKDATTEDAALAVWMLLHGLSAILIADKIPVALRQDRAAQDLADTFVRALCRGLLI